MRAGFVDRGQKRGLPLMATARVRIKRGKRSRRDAFFKRGSRPMDGGGKNAVAALGLGARKRASDVGAGERGRAWLGRLPFGHRGRLVGPVGRVGVLSPSAPGA